MRILIGIALCCTLVLGINNAKSSAAPQAQSVEQLSSPIVDQADEADESPVDTESYICLWGAPRCQRADQCVAYCAGGAPVCFQGCCSCAS